MPEIFPLLATALSWKLAYPPELQAWVMGLTFILGVCIGSFLNVVGLRFLAEESISHPPSACPHCKTPIQPFDNIPVVSYLLLGGQCRHCKAGISIQYPLIELATGLLFCLVVWHFGIGLQALFLLFLVANLVVIFITDLRESLIFQINSLSLIPAGLLYNLLNLGNHGGSTALDMGVMVFHIPDAFTSALIAVGISLVFFEGLILLSTLLFGTEGFGHGDTHLMMGAGAYLGWPLTILALFLGFVVQAMLAVPMLVIQWIKNRQYVSLASGGVAFVSGLMPIILMKSAISIDTQAWLTLVCLVISLAALVVFMRQIKTSQSFTYLPLGPALVIGILIALFWGKPLLASYLHLITPG